MTGVTNRFIHLSLTALAVVTSVVSFLLIGSLISCGLHSFVSSMLTGLR